MLFILLTIFLWFCLLLILLWVELWASKKENTHMHTHARARTCAHCFTTPKAKHTQNCILGHNPNPVLIHEKRHVQTTVFLVSWHIAVSDTLYSAFRILRRKLPIGDLQDTGTFLFIIVEHLSQELNYATISLIQWCFTVLSVQKITLSIVSVAEIKEKVTRLLESLVRKQTSNFIVKWTWNIFEYSQGVRRKHAKSVSSELLLCLMIVPSSNYSLAVMERSGKVDFFTTFHELCAKLLTSQERSTLRRSLQIYQTNRDVTTFVSDTQFIWSSPNKLQLLPFVRHVIAVNDRQQFDALLGVHEGLVVRGPKTDKSSSMSSSKSGNRLTELTEIW